MTPSDRFIQWSAAGPVLYTCIRTVSQQYFDSILVASKGSVVQRCVTRLVPGTDTSAVPQEQLGYVSITTCGVV